MYTLRKRLALSGKARTLLPALAFLGAATLAAAGAGTVAALCLVPAGIVLDIGRPHAGGGKQPAIAGDHSNSSRSI